MSQAFLVPFGRSNAGVVIGGIVLLVAPAVVLPFLSQLNPGFKFLQLAILLWLGFGFSMFFRGLLDASCRGEDRFMPWPDDPDARGVTDMVFGTLFAYLAAFLPLIVLRLIFIQPDDSGDMVRACVDILATAPVPIVIKGPVWLFPVLCGMSALGAIYFPMALVAASQSGTTAPLNPATVLTASIRTRPASLRVSLVVAVLIAALYATTYLSWIGGPVAFYAAAVTAKMSGSLYVEQGHRLGWS